MGLGLKLLDEIGIEKKSGLALGGVPDRSKGVTYLRATAGPASGGFDAIR